MTRKDLEHILGEYEIRRFLVIERLGELEVFVRGGGAKRHCIFTAVSSCFPVGVTVKVRNLPWWKCLFRKKQWVNNRVNNL